MMIQISGKSVKKLSISKAESFVKSNSDLNQVCKTLVRQSIKFETLTQLTCFIFFLLKIRNVLKLSKMSENILFKETRPSYDQKFAQNN